MFPYEQKHCNTTRVIQLLWWCLEIQITLNWDSCFTIYCTQNYFPYLVFLYTAAKTPDLNICPHYLVSLNFTFSFGISFRIFPEIYRSFSLSSRKYRNYRFRYKICTWLGLLSFHSGWQRKVRPHLSQRRTVNAWRVRESCFLSWCRYW